MQSRRCGISSQSRLSDFSLGPSLAGADVHTYDLIEENNYLPELEKIDKNYWIKQSL